MLGRKFFSHFRAAPASQIFYSSAVPKPMDEGKSRSLGRKVVSAALICLTGGVALSAIDDLAIYHGCSSKAMEKASKDPKVLSTIGEPVVKGSWYSASLAVAHKRNSVSCSFPVSGPQGDGILRLKAVRNGDNSWFSFFRPREFEILMMDAVLHVPKNEEKDQTIKITISDNLGSTASPACQPCIRSPEPSASAQQFSFGWYTRKGSF